jgi:hypothetical protein
MSHAQGLWTLLVCAFITHFAAAQNSVSLRSPREEAAWQSINRGLETVVTFRFSETPLDEAAKKLLDQAGISFIIDRKALDDFGIDSNTPISLELRQVTARSFLTTMLEESELTWMIRGELLRITTPEKAEAHLITRIYPVRDLIEIRQGKRRGEDYDSLIQLIQSTVAPDSWDEVGGPGAIDEFSNFKAIVVSQTGYVHDGIDDLITALRKTRRLLGLPVLELPPPRQEVDSTQAANPEETRNARRVSRRRLPLYGVAQGS